MATTPASEAALQALDAAKGALRDQAIRTLYGEAVAMTGSDDWIGIGWDTSRALSSISLENPVQIDDISLPFDANVHMLTSRLTVAFADHDRWRSYPAVRAAFGVLDEYGWVTGEEFQRIVRNED